jgi:hypothetical protein
MVRAKSVLTTMVIQLTMPPLSVNRKLCSARPGLADGRSFAVIMPEMAVRSYWSHENVRFGNS